jgi:NAD(P)-dependent dehydrogenase (short-subunit alcohol dehydrogenase family)
MRALEGKVAIITGAAGGLGGAVADRYVAEGARVCLTDVSPAVEERSRTLGDAACAVVADVTSWDGNVAIVEAAQEAFGRVDILVCNAGVYDHGIPLPRIPGERLGDAFFELFSVNVLGYLLGARATVPALLQTRGCIVMTVSRAGEAPGGGGALYTASKHAVRGLIRQLAYEFVPHIRVNGVSPGVIPTRLRGLRALDQEAADSLLPGTRESLPMGVVPNPDAYSLLYVAAASDELAGVMTGTVLSADNGAGLRAARVSDALEDLVGDE